VPDDIICPLVQNRINQTDCQIHGYFLDGFPVTIKQWNRFCQWHTMPSIVVCYRVDNSELEYNIKHSKIDPENGEVYHDTETELLPADVQARLEVTGEDIRELLRTRTKCIDKVFGEMDKRIKSRCLTIYADNQVSDIIRQLTTILQNSHYYS